MNRAYNIDCMEYMHTLPDNHFTLAIADPPYGIGKDWKITFTDGYKTYIILSAYDNIDIYRGTISLVRYTDNPYLQDRQYLHNTDNIISICISI